MRSSQTVCRALAEALSTLAAEIFPSSRQEWAAAMRAELAHIDDDTAAIGWAIGCLRAGLFELCRLESLLNLRVVRWAVAAWILFQAEGNVCSSLLVLTYKLRYLQWTQFLSRCSDVKDYRSLVPLFDATAVWEPALCLVGGTLYVLGIVAVVRRSRSAYMLFVPALLSDIGLWLYELTKPLFVEVYSSADFTHDVIVYTGTALMITALWQGMRPQQRSMP